MTKQDSGVHQAGWGRIILVYALCVLAASSISQAVPVVGEIARTFPGSGRYIGWVISIPSALVALFALPVGWISDRVGDKQLTLVGSALLVVGDIGVVMADSINQLLAMRVLEGLGYVCVAVGTAAMLTRITTGPRRTAALTLWSSFVPMSFAIPLTLAGVLAGMGHWRWAFGGHAIVTALLALGGLALPARPKYLGPSEGQRAQGLGLVLRTPAVYGLGAAFALAAFVQTGITTTFAHMLAHRYDLSVPAASQVVTLGMLFNFAGCLAMGPLLNRGVSRALLATWGIALAAAGALVLYQPGSSIELAVAGALLFYFAAGLVVGLWALLPAVAPGPATRGATSGLVTQLTLWGVLFGPPAGFAALAAGPGWQMSYACAALAASLVLLLMVIRAVAATAATSRASP